MQGAERRMNIRYKLLWWQGRQKYLSICTQIGWNLGALSKANLRYQRALGHHPGKVLFGLCSDFPFSVHVEIIDCTPFRYYSPLWVGDYSI